MKYNGCQNFEHLGRITNQIVKKNEDFINLPYRHFSTTRLRTTFKWNHGFWSLLSSWYLSELQKKNRIKVKSIQCNLLNNSINNLTRNHQQNNQTNYLRIETMCSAPFSWRNFSPIPSAEACICMFWINRLNHCSSCPWTCMMNNRSHSCKQSFIRSSK